jgi:hypothetical protein
MTNFFRRIQPQSPVVRNNYFIQVDDKLAWSESIGDEYSEGIGWFTVCFYYSFITTHVLFFGKDDTR